MRNLFLVIVLLVVSQGTLAQRAPQSLSELAGGGVPDCPIHPGVRTLRTEVAHGFDMIVFIEGVAKRGNQGCGYSAQIVVEQKEKHPFRLPDPSKWEFSIVDFSPDGQSLLMSRDLRDSYPNIEYRDQEVTTMSLSTGQMNWVNVWDLFGWGDCDATVEAQGFTNEGKVVLRPRPAVWTSHPHPDCVKSAELFATDLKPADARRLPDDAKVERYGKTIHPSYGACKTDPDIIGACFTVHGRLSAWNGTPPMRIWRVGTKRVLGVPNEILPEEVANRMDWGIEAYGDFMVCPFTQERPGEMQMVCIESAENVIYKKR
jgi:hypothetical protein